MRYLEKLLNFLLGRSHSLVSLSITKWPLSLTCVSSVNPSTGKSDVTILQHMFYAIVYVAEFFLAL